MNNRRLLEGPVLKSLLIFALPLLVSNIFQQLYNTVDTIIIGNHLGVMSLAALGASMAVFQLLVGFALGFGNGFGIKGAAIATVIAQGVSVVLSVGYIILKVPMLIPHLSHFRPEKKMFTDLIGQGASMALMSSFVIIGTVILQYAINDMGYLIIAGHIIARRIHSLLLLPVIAIVLSVPTFISQNKGAGNGERILKCVRYSVIIVAGW